MLSVVLAVLAATSNALASVLQRTANQHEAATGSDGWRSITRLLRRPVWWCGFAAVVASFALQAAALALGGLALVQPLLTLELPLTLVLASWLFSRRLLRADWLNVLAMSTGLALLLLALLPHGGDPTRPNGAAWLAATGSSALLVVGLVWSASVRRGSGRAVLLGMASGVSFALTAVLMAAGLATGLPDAFARWQTYLLAVSGLLAMLLLQKALQAGPLVAVQPGVTLIDPVLAIVLGVLLFHEQVRTGWWTAAAAAGGGLIGWGAVRLCRSPLLTPVGDAEKRAGGDAPGPWAPRSPATPG